RSDGGLVSTTLNNVVALAAERTGVRVEAVLRDRALEAHLEAWTPHTYTDPDATPLLCALRERGICTGLLSNTHWPREWHERILARDGVLDLIDARVYTSELAHTKPHAEAFRAVLAPLRVEPDEAVMVGDRPLDDISGARAVGMRAVLLPNDQVPPGGVAADAALSARPEALSVSRRG